VTVSEADASGVAPAAGHTPDRMATFTDAIFAIAMTLLVVEIKRPEDQDFASPQALAHFLADEWEQFFAFGLAFMLLWSVWRRHHILMDRIDRLNRAVAFWHAPLLLLVAFFPFPTGLIGHANNAMAACLFAATEAALLGCEGMIKETVYRSSILSEGVNPADVRLAASKTWAVAAFFAASAVLAWWVPHIYYAWPFASPVAHYGGRLVDKLR
jgi:uncharacterized membrane protein